MSVSRSNFNLNTSPVSAEFASGINWSVQNGADIINCSWGDQNGSQYSIFYSAVLQNAIINALTNALTNARNGKGCILIFASGNNGGIDYPGNFHPDIITVGAINQMGQRVTSPPNSAFGSKLDVVAPGKDILSTSLNNGLFIADGTSFAAPHVSGIAALILSVNPCLTREQVTNIIEQTSQKVGGYNYTSNALRPNGTWHNEVGYGLVDAHAAVVMAQQQLVPTNPDLYIADSNSDFGVEPSNAVISWNSPDIWVRNQQDTNQTHQAPLYNPANPNYVFIKVRNKGCNISTGNEVLKIYAKVPNNPLTGPTASYRISSPMFTTQDASSIIPNTFSMQQIGSLTIPALNGGQMVILSFPWNVPNPVGLFDCTTSTFDTFIYAKIVSNTDLMTVPETASYLQNIINNNNIAGKSSVVIAPQNAVGNLPTVYESSLLLSNFNTTNSNYTVELIKENTETGKLIYEESEVVLSMEQNVYDAWQRGGNVSQNLVATTDDLSKKITTDNVQINNISLYPQETGKINLKFNFLTSEYSNKTKYNYHFVVKNATSNEIIGGTTFSIEKPIRQLFYADAGGTVLVDSNEPITITANTICEPATYNWYDATGHLIYTGKNLQVATEAATEYRLEVIATVDGFKDYSSVAVKIKPSELSAIAPNPASNETTIHYKLNETTSAYLMVIGSYGSNNTSYNYILDLNSSQTTLDISNYPSGFYTVALVCNGNIVDAKTLVKQ